MVATIAFVSGGKGMAGELSGEYNQGVSPTGREAAYLNLSLQQTPLEGA